MRKLAVLMVGSLAALAVACGGGGDEDEVDSQATIDAAVQASVAAQPTATPDVQATIDAAVAASAQAMEPTSQPEATSTPEPERAPLRFDEDALRALLAEEEIPSILGGGEIADSGFVDFIDVANPDITSKADSFTGIIFQGPSTSLNLQIIDLMDSFRAIDEIEDQDETFSYTALSPAIGDRAYQVQGEGVSAITFASGDLLVSVFYTDAAAGAPEFEALRALAELVASRL